MNTKSRASGVRRAAIVFVAGILVGVGGALLFRAGGSGIRAMGDDDIQSFFPSIVREAHAALDDGDYEFFPNRRMIWVVNRTNGRMANYDFHDDELGSVDRSRVATIDLKTFPRKDTLIQMSDRNMNQILWLCNTRTGDVQKWVLDRNGSLKGETPVASSTDLLERAAKK